MKLFLILIFITLNISIYSQDTLDIAVDSLHQSIFKKSLIKIQNWNTHITRSSENLLIINSIKDSFKIEIDSFNIPFDGYMTSHYGERWNVWHAGVDIGLKTGDKVKVAWDGVVRYAKMNHGGYGNLIIVRHRNGLETYYAHLSRIKVVNGQKVSGGDVIGLGGNTGHSYGAHLHFEVRFYDVSIDPELLIDFREKKIISSNLLVSKDLIKGNVTKPINNNNLNQEFESIEFILGITLPISDKIKK